VAEYSIIDVVSLKLLDSIVLVIQM